MTKKLSSYEMELDAAAKEHSKNCKALEYIYEDKSKMSWAEQEERPSSILGNIEIGFKAGAAWEKTVMAKSPMQIKQEKIQLTHIETVIELHVIYQDIKKINKWLTSENVNLGDMEPIKLIIEGKGDKVLQFIKGARKKSQSLLDDSEL